MPQLFHPSMNTISRVSIFGAVFFVAAALVLPGVIMRTSYINEVGVIREQPVPFSHEHHVGDVGLDCRYCHGGVEQSPFAGMPATKTCMKCHSQLFVDSNLLAPVRESYRENRPLRWTRVHDVPDYAHFDHSIHIHKGVGCTTCHGPVNEMPLMWRESSLTMLWCLDCHRDPGPNLRPREAVFSMESTSTAREKAERSPEELLEAYQVQSKTSCSVCHR